MKRKRPTKAKPTTPLPLRRSKYQIFPVHPPDRHEALATSITQHGVETPTTWDEEGNPLDGWERETICQELGTTCPREVRQFGSEAEKFQFILAVNAHRRPSLNQKQKREVIAGYLKGDPEVADNMLGETLGVSKNTVLAVRRRLEASRQVPKLKKTRGKDGKVRPVRYAKRIITNTPREFEKAKAIIRDLPDDCAGKTLDITTAKKRARMTRDGHNSAPALPPPATWDQDVQPGVKIIRGSCLDRGLLGGTTIDLCVTSPPFNCGTRYDSTDDNLSPEEYWRFTEQWLGNVHYWLKDDGRLCVNVPAATHNNPTFPFDFVNVARKIGFQFQNTIYWDKINSHPDHTSWGSWASPAAPFIRNEGLELILLFCKKQWKKAKKGRRTDLTPTEYHEWTQNVWRFAGEARKDHPAAFPEELPRRCIKLFSWIGDTVLDPFGGSGTSLVVCRQRQGIAIEVSPRYCVMMRERLVEGSEADRRRA